MKKLNHSHTTCLRKILDIIWQKHIPNTEVLTRVSLPSIYTILMQSQLHWTGYVVHMKDHCLLKKLVYGKLSRGKLSQGDQKKRFKDTLKVSMKYFSITSNCLGYLVQDRDKWHKVVKHGAKVCETRRNASIELFRKLRKVTATSTTATTILCSHCPRLFHTHLSHQPSANSQMPSSIIRLIKWSSSIKMNKKIIMYTCTYVFTNPSIQIQHNVIFKWSLTGLD